MSRTPSPRAVTCGLSTLDLLYYLDRIPHEDEKITAEDLVVDAGGPALNAAVTARHLGVAATHVSPIGSSPTGLAIHAFLRTADVGVLDTQPDLLAPVVSTVLVSTVTGSRTVVAINAAATAPQTLRDLGVLDGATAVLVDGHHMRMAIELAAAARERGIPVLMDAGSWKVGTRELLAHVDLCIVSAAFTLDGEAVDDLTALCALGPHWVARTHGGGAVELVCADGGRELVPVPPVPVVDTLGAGDVFHGAALAHVTRHGLDAQTVPDALRAGVAAAGASVGHRGAHTWVRQPT
ncbi:MAG: PfkB family carbohydrate kinase [Cellulomonadaceae bacterium]